MTGSSISRLIAANRVLGDLPPEFIDSLAEHAIERELAQGEVVFRHGESAETFYIVRQGTVAVEVAAIEGPPLVLQRLDEGALLGWSWLIPPYRWNFQARAETPVQVVEFDGRAVREHCEQDPRLGYEILKRFTGLMSERLDEARTRMMEEWSPSGFA
ncbi:MAG: cyclic nucleotide-binding domain-containing protein [Halofilum sp. (in: g-proteobacteria)]|nr:cyclic nucleotide-binding domain-containing protein [Halofilum sp. (in: g-proteobacteria)]